MDSRWIDVLLNLVSEAVINKASMNQIVSTIADVDSKIESERHQLASLLAETRLRLPEALNGVRADIVAMLDQMGSLFDQAATNIQRALTRFRTDTATLGRITAALQEGVMRIRMVPISQIFSRFPRLVRDLSRTPEKDVRLQLEGGDRRPVGSTHPHHPQRAQSWPRARRRARGGRKTGARDPVP